MPPIYLRNLLFALLVPLLVASCFDDDDDDDNNDNDTGAVRFTVLHTNDHHGNFWKNKDGELGMAARKTLIDQITAEVEDKGGEVLLLSGGEGQRFESSRVRQKSL